MPLLRFDVVTFFALHVRHAHPLIRLEPRDVALMLVLLVPIYHVLALGCLWPSLPVTNRCNAMLFCLSSFPGLLFGSFVWGVRNTRTILSGFCFRFTLVGSDL